MAHATVEFYSQSLNRNVQFQAILPDLPDSGQKLKTLYLLHGAFGSASDWLHYTRISLWAQERSLAVILPSGENSYYVDDCTGRSLYSQFIGDELVAYTRKLFPLSRNREDTFLCGLSMGGYGALTNGFKYWHTFGWIAALSASLRLEDYAVAADGPQVPYLLAKGYVERTFGPVAQIPGSDKDYRALALAVPPDRFPKLYLCCGTEDDLLQRNRDFRDFLAANNLLFTYEEGPGGHDWEFWNNYILRVLNWLPLSTI